MNNFKLYRKSTTSSGSFYLWGVIVRVLLSTTVLTPCLVPTVVLAQEPTESENSGAGTEAAAEAVDSTATESDTVDAADSAATDSADPAATKLDDLTVVGGTPEPTPRRSSNRAAASTPPASNRSPYRAPVSAAPVNIASVSSTADAFDRENMTAVQAEALATGPGDGYVADYTTTGSRVPTPLRDIPSSVSIVTREQLDERQPMELDDALGYMAGVTPSIWGVDNRFNQFLIRGFDVGSSSIYRDGMSQKVLNFSGFKIEPWALDRIEVLKGPAGVLYGENDAGGLVNAITKRPVFERFSNAYAGYGTFNTFEAAFDTGNPLQLNNDVAVRLTGFFRDGGLQFDSAENDRVFIAPAFSWQPSDKTNLTILTNYQWDNLAPNQFLPIAGIDYDASLGNLPESFYNSQHGFNQFDANHGSVGVLFTHQFNDSWIVRQNMRYSQQDTDYKHLYFGWMNSATDMQFVAFTVDETARIFNTDSQVQFNSEFLGIDNTLLVGFDYNRNWVDGENGWEAASNYVIDVRNPNLNVRVTNPELYFDGTQLIDRSGLYAQDQARLWENVLVTLGIRQSWIYNEVNDRFAGFTGQSDTNTSYAAGVGYDFASGITPYASYTETFVTNLGTTFASVPYSPSEGEQHEVGVKYQPNSFNGFFTFAWFDITKTNVLTTDPNNAGFQVQTGEVNHSGVELEGNFNLTDGLSMTAAYTYLDAEIASDNDGNVGNIPAIVPEHQASVWANYLFQSGFLEGLSLGAGVRYIGESYGDNANTLLVDSYTLVDAAVRYQSGQYELSVNATNLFDEEYFSTCAVGSGCIRGEERVIMGRLARKW